MKKEFWVLGLVKSGNDSVRVKVFSSEHVLPKGDVLQPLAVLPSKEEAKRVKRYFRNAWLINLWGTRFHIVVDHHTGRPSIMAFRLDESDYLE